MVKHLTAAILLHPWSNLSRSTRLFMRAVYEASNPALPKDMSKMRWLPVNAAAVLCCYLITRVTCLAQPIIPVRLFSRPWIWKLPLAEEPSYSKAHMLLSSREGRPKYLARKTKKPYTQPFLNLDRQFNQTNSCTTSWQPSSPFEWSSQLVSTRHCHCTPP
jgi:hypothetical protein